MARQLHLLRFAWPEHLDHALSVATWLSPFAAAAAWYMNWLATPDNPDWLLAFFGGAATIAGFQLAALALVLGLIERLHDVGRGPIVGFVKAMVSSTWWWFAVTFATVLLWAGTVFVIGTGSVPTWSLAGWLCMVFAAAMSACKAILWAGRIANKVARTGQ